MKGDVIVLERHHIEAGEKIASNIIEKMSNKKGRYIITVSGESGSGKSETAKAISDALSKTGIKSVVLGQDDYFFMPPKSNDRKRREDSDWLGPHAEVQMELLNRHIALALNGEDSIMKPLVNYTDDSISEEAINLKDVSAVIVEGTYTALLRQVDCRVFINRGRQDTLEHRQKRNRGNEAGDPFVENVLKTEHKIIAGHRFLADVVISRDYEVSFV